MMCRLRVGERKPLTLMQKPLRLGCVYVRGWRTTDNDRQHQQSSAGSCSFSGRTDLVLTSVLEDLHAVLTGDDTTADHDVTSAQPIPCMYPKECRTYAWLQHCEYRTGRMNPCGEVTSAQMSVSRASLYQLEGRPRLTGTMDSRPDMVVGWYIC